jgi:hypothetical protein
VSSGLGWAAGMEFAGEESRGVSVGLDDYECKKTVKVFWSGRLQAAIFRARAL